ATAVTIGGVAVASIDENGDGYLFVTLATGTPDGTQTVEVTTAHGSDDTHTVEVLSNGSGASNGKGNGNGGNGSGLGFLGGCASGAAPTAAPSLGLLLLLAAWTLGLMVRRQVAR